MHVAGNHGQSAPVVGTSNFSRVRAVPLEPLASVCTWSTQRGCNTPLVKILPPLFTFTKDLSSLERARSPYGLIPCPSLQSLSRCKEVVVFLVPPLHGPHVWAAH